MPVRTPFNSGMTFPTALAAPVEDGMRLATAALQYSNTDDDEKMRCEYQKVMTCS